MISLWSDEESLQLESDLSQRVYSTRLLGRDKSLVLHGGGNTSVKGRQRNIFGEKEELLYVKGSGWDLETIEEAGFSPVNLQYLRRLATLPTLSDPQMVNEMVTHMTRATAPVPSVEAILHAILPHKFVDHTHADAVITVSNSPGGEARIREIYGNRVVVIPYVMPGFDLARLCAERFNLEAGPGTLGMVLLNHGIFSFGATAKESYERMILLVGLAEAYLQAHKAWDASPTVPRPAQKKSGVKLAQLRKKLSSVAGAPMIVTRNPSEKCLAFSQRPDLTVISQQGPATPDHVIRTKRVPMLGLNVDEYAKAYKGYFERLEPLAKERKTILDAAPRIVIDPDLGICTVGKTAKDAAIVAEIFDHTIDIVLRATALGGYQALSEKHILTSSTGTWSRPSCAKPGIRQSLRARSHWLPAPRPASGRHA